MMVEIFESAHDYKGWLNGNRLAIEVMNVVVFDEYLVVTYTAK